MRQYNNLLVITIIKIVLYLLISIRNPNGPLELIIN